MKRIAVLTALLLVLSGLAFAGQYNIVPLDNEAYRIIEYAEIQGIIPMQSKAKPYDYLTVIELLERISASSLYENSSGDSGLYRISYVMAELDRLYGKNNIKSKKDVWYNGLYRTVNEENGNAFAVGVKGVMKETGGLDNDKNKIIDSRNTGTLYFSGDLFDTFSFNMNASLKLDALNPRAYLTEEFLYDADGDYFLGAGSDETYVNNFTNELDGVHLGFKAQPEMAASLFKRHMTIRFGSYKRDWGPGLGNIVLSESAEDFNALELYIRPVKWFSFSSLTGSLSRSYVKTIYGIRRAGYESESEPEVTTPTSKDISYDTMFSMQRLEFNIKDRFQIGLFESVVWKKRLELAYLNPFSIYWFAQSMTGDIDSLIGGMDFTLTIPKFGQAYLVVSVDEYTSDLAHLISAARNIMAFQAGIRMPGVLLGNFTTFTLQGTYIPPFYGTHHYQEDKDGTWYATSFVNKGFNLFYPLNPDSLEILFDCDVSLKKGWGLHLTARDQMRSSQYSIGDNGTDILTVLNYSKDEEYARKKFFKNIWNNIFDIKLVVSKKFDFFPMKVSVGLEAIFDWSRDYQKALSYDPVRLRYNSGLYNTGHLTSVDGSTWRSADIRFLGSVLFSLYY